jgi:hypothetical protein
MIVCADLGKENRANMEAAVVVSCRQCGKVLAADTRTIGVAERLPERQGRPIKFFCCRCAMKYHPGSITHYADHSAAQDGGAAIRAANPKAINVEVSGG